jgi:ATP-dependent RNA helicase DeaD
MAGTEPLPAPDGKERKGARAPAGPKSRDAERATRSTWSKVFVNVGRQDGAAPGDFVGAITGETGAVGGQIGKIEIKQKFSLIDIDSMVVDDVVRGLNGKQIKGRDVVARLDRDG